MARIFRLAKQKKLLVLKRNQWPDSSESGFFVSQDRE